ncbi:MAG: DUF2235 domain-containing protein [Acidobacteriaceae bacterium]
MPKNIVICCDGTGDEFGATTNSNVVKLYQTLTIDARQSGYYHPGLGTMGAPNARTWIEKQWTRVLGLGMGYGFFDYLGDAYHYLMDTYEPGDRIYLFGFSRGAYTVRALATILHLFGLLQRGNEGQFPYITRMLSKISRNADGKANQFSVFWDFKRTFSRNVTLHFVGVWDTVSSVGWVYNPVKLPFSARNPIMAIGRQALSIDERRCFFRQNLWGPAYKKGDRGYFLEQDQDIKQVWFAGVHSDIGGGYPEPESGLSKLALEWMLHEADDAGLLINIKKANVVLSNVPPDRDPGHVIAKPDPCAALHESLHGPWWGLEVLPHSYWNPDDKAKHWEVPMGRHRVMPEDSCVYQSVVDRISHCNYKPSNLPQSYTTEPYQHYPKRAGATE